MPAIVGEGRRVINNIQRAASLFLVKNIFSLLLSLVSLFAGFPYPLLPLQLSLIGSLTIGIPSFFLALEPNNSRVEGHFLSNVFYKALPGGLTNLVLVLGVELFTYAFAFPLDQLYTISAITVLFVGLLVLYQVCRPFDWEKAGYLGQHDRSRPRMPRLFRKPFQPDAADPADRPGARRFPASRPAGHAYGPLAFRTGSRLFPKILREEEAGVSNEP